MKTPTLLGIPLDENSSYLRGPADAPPKIREALGCEAMNSWTESGVDLGVKGIYDDAGDLEFVGGDAFSQITEKVHSLLATGARPVLLGGDHSITFPILQAAGPKYPELTIVHFDAHPDLYDEFEGSKTSHACPFARIMENKLAKRLTQIGIRTINRHQREQAARFGVDVIEMRSLPGFGQLKNGQLEIGQLKIGGPVYISFDIDCLDPAFAPGVSHREPGGLSVREAITYLHAIEGNIVGADLVEYNPVQDISGVTAIVAAKILKEILGMMIAE
jgi:arginase